MLICWGRPCKVRLFTHIPCGADLLCPYSRLVAFRVLTCMLLTCRGGLLVTRCPPSAVTSASCSSPGSVIFPFLFALHFRQLKFDAETFWLWVNNTVMIRKFSSWSKADLKVFLVIHLGAVLLQHQVDLHPGVDAELVSGWNQHQINSHCQHHQSINQPIINTILHELLEAGSHHPFPEQPQSVGHLGQIF